MTDAVVLAGGRISGLFARAAGTRIKALASVRGRPVVHCVAEALLAARSVGRVCVVGPEAIREAVPEGCLWQLESDSAYANACAGLERLATPGDARVLLCGADLPFLKAEAVDDLLARLPEEADVALPVVRKEVFQAAFPGDLGIYVRLREGRFTGGDQAILRVRALRENSALLQTLYRSRKSQLAMTRAFGADTMWKLVRGTLTVGELEARASELTGRPCRAVLDCRPELAFDIDTVVDLRYANRR
jgi:molybdopterin-guanine dinucleotide biosynthesis protein A